ncbi:hypothetical protein Acr_01g0009990 [Actinidia rufa]|uniref:PRA1 family protein n=1 Tax=Actinidia rufa TaxID=165716 RepID=A0A7J0E447_9ERIC|nr:hypothetical protein Acr_01g0009990 [Actinidia rufa]
MSMKSPSGYGSVPTTTSFMSRAKAQTQTLISTRRPWRELFDLSAFSLPDSYTEAMSRIRRNLNYFRPNYALVMLIIVFISLEVAEGGMLSVVGGDQPMRPTYTRG